VVLDEACVAMGLRLITEAAVLALLRRVPEGVDVVLTGRGATERLERLADLVTHCGDTKHPFRGGKKARKGVEY
jgi:cob(I)alamin adenosyltransferase